MNQTELSNFLDEVLDELQYRIDEGLINLNNPTHKSILSEILTEQGQSHLLNPIVSSQLLTEADPKYKDKPSNPSDEDYSHLGNGIYVKKGNEDKPTAPKFKKDEQGNYKAMSAAEAGDIKQKAGEDGGSNNNPQAKTDDGSKPADAQSGGGAGGEQAEVPPVNIFDDPEYQKRIKDNESSTREIPISNIANESPKNIPDIGKLSDSTDANSDGGIKQKGLEIGYNESNGFKPAPGNAGSMLAEIMSGECYSYLNSNPDLPIKELAMAIYDQVKDTTLGKQNHGSTTIKKGEDAGKHKELWVKSLAIAESGAQKFKRSQSAINYLVENDMFELPAKSLNFWGHSTSIEKQIQLIEKATGPYYTRTGDRIPKTQLIELIQQSGHDENPSDTSTLTIDSKGRLLVEFHSDKLTTNDIQANSTPNKESENAIELLNNDDNINGLDASFSIQTIANGQALLNQKEKELKQAGAEPADIISKYDPADVLDRIDSSRFANSLKGRLDKILIKSGKPHSFFRDKLEPKDTGEEYSKEELLQGFLDAYKDIDNENEPTGEQVKFMTYLSKEYDLNVGSSLSKIRKESLDIQRDTHRKLNERSITLPNGNIKKLGDYIEAKNIIDKLHINIVDGEHGVGKYKGLFNVNMGGTIVEGKQLTHCLNIDDTNDFISHFEVGTPDDGGDIEYSDSKGNAISGNRVFVYAITKKGIRIPFAYKTQRSKQGPTGKLNTTYQWHPDTQQCFKENQ